MYVKLFKFAEINVGPITIKLYGKTVETVKRRSNRKKRLGSRPLPPRQTAEKRVFIAK